MGTTDSLGSSSSDPVSFHVDHTPPVTKKTTKKEQPSSTTDPKATKEAALHIFLQQTIKDFAEQGQGSSDNPSTFEFLHVDRAAQKSHDKVLQLLRKDTNKLLDKLLDFEGKPLSRRRLEKISDKMTILQKIKKLPPEKVIALNEDLKKLEKLQEKRKGKNVYLDLKHFYGEIAKGGCSALQDLLDGFDHVLFEKPDQYRSWRDDEAFW